MFITKTLPDISKWDLSNVNNISRLFDGCSLLKKIPDISNWNTNKIKDIHEMFLGCSKLESLPEMLMIFLEYFMNVHL